uniref:Fcf2 pre-rRNA processing C-terminal domain-containing protein n=1 Tax=Callorhinchus milii TaxID=7868 RepID=A0A4W3HK41_CALMI|eukprot:gi/632940445/ref/XP_007885323.1/ PREDICTED: deoxynucleotidyltransferase terminal-interacting protein 2 [Callorhinchus milii]
MEPAELSDEVKLNDQSAESLVPENCAETESKNPVELIELTDDVPRDVVDEQKDEGSENQNADTIISVPIISLLFSSDDSSDIGTDTNIVVEEESAHVQSSALKTTTGQSSSGEDNCLFVIDTKPGIDVDREFYLDSSRKEIIGKSSQDIDQDEELEQEEKEDSFIDGDDDEEEGDEAILLSKSSRSKLSTSIDTGLDLNELGGLYITFDAGKMGHDSKISDKLKKEKKTDELLAKSILTPDFEKKDCVPPYKQSLRQLKKQRKEEREKTTGDGWYNMKAPELTRELTNDLQALKMRAAFDSKRFYKKNDRDGFPKYFQVGTILDNPVDFYHSRIPKKQRKRTVVDELLADAEFRRNNKKKYQKIVAEQAVSDAGKKNRKKNKFEKRSRKKK